MTKINSIGSTIKASSIDQKKTEVEEARVELEKFMESDDYKQDASHDSRDRLEELDVTLRAISAALNGDGNYGPGGISDPSLIDDPYYYEVPDDLNPRWNGVNEAFIITDDIAGESMLTEEGVEYLATIYGENSGNETNPTVYAFQMTEEMSNLKLENHGKDIVLTFEENGVTKGYLIKEGAKNGIPIIISALGLEGPVSINCEKAYFKDSTENTPKLIIHGSKGDDEIKGAQSRTLIAGWEGNDTIIGGAGNDTIFGDEIYEMAGTYSPDGGDDDIDGGMGNDNIRGGGGLDIGYHTDETDLDKPLEVDTWGDSKVETLPVPDKAWINGGSNWEAEIEGSIIVVDSKNTDDAGEITIDLDKLSEATDQTWKMCFGKFNEYNDLIITVVNEEGSTFTIKVKDFKKAGLWDGANPKNRVPKLTIKGGDGDEIIDFSKCELTSQIIDIEAGGGDNIVLGAYNIILMAGVDPDSITDSTAGAGEIGTAKEDVFEGLGDTDEKAFPWETTDDNGDQVTISLKQGFKIDNEGKLVNPSNELKGDAKVNISAPIGYEKGFITNDKDSIYVILYNDQGKTIVYKIEDGVNKNLNYNDIIVQGVQFKDENGTTVTGSTYGFDLISIDLDLDNTSGVYYNADVGEINVEGGDDMVVALKGTKTDADEDELVTIEYDGLVDSFYTYTSGSTTPTTPAKTYKAASEFEDGIIEEGKVYKMNEAGNKYEVGTDGKPIEDTDEA